MECAHNSETRYKIVYIGDKIKNFKVKHLNA